MIRESPLRVEYGAHLSRLRILSMAVTITVLTACNNATSPLHENETHSRVVRSVTVPVTWYDARDSEQIDKLLQSAPHHADMMLEYVASLDLDEMPHLEQQQITVCNLTAALKENWWTGNNYESIGNAATGPECKTY